MWVMSITGCSTTLPSQAHQAFDSCNYNKVQEVIASMDVKEKDILLYDLALLSAGVHGNMPDVGIKYGTRALSNMWSFGDAVRGNVSLVSSEAARDYKGEPYEKTMAGIYLGTLFFNQGDFENARAAFQKAVLASATKSKVRNENVPLAHFLLGLVMAHLGQEDNARISLEKAQMYSDVFDQLTPDDYLKIQTLVIAETGQAPKKIRTGPGNSVVDYQPLRSNIQSASLRINDQLVTSTAMVEDLYIQAKENERAKKEAIQKTKGVVKDVSTVVAIGAATQADESKTARNVAIVAGLLAVANQSQADTRQWSFLPARLHITWSDQPQDPGQVDYSLMFYDRNRRVLHPYTQRWTDMREADRPKIYIQKAKTCGTKQ